MSNFNEYEQICLEIGDITLYMYEDFELDLYPSTLQPLVKANTQEEKKAIIKELLDDAMVDHFDNELECVEGFANDNGLLSDQSEVQQRLENDLAECSTYADIHTMERDAPMISEYIHNTLDCWVKNGTIHEEQYNNYDIELDFTRIYNLKRNQ